MSVNPALTKQQARQAAALGLPLWRQLVAVGSSGSSSSSSGGGGKLDLTPKQIRQQVAAFAAQSEANSTFVSLPANRNINNHMGALSQLLTCHDDPLTISADELTDRYAAAVAGPACGTPQVQCLLARASP